MLEPFEIVRQARLSLGTPYKHQGRKSQVGLDCIGLIVVVGHSLGLFSHDLKSYGRIADGTLEREIKKYCQPLEVPQVGALALFKLSGSYSHHCGIISEYRDDWGLIHAYQNVGRVKEHKMIDWWRVKMTGIYALPNVNYG